MPTSENSEADQVLTFGFLSGTLRNMVNEGNPASPRTMENTMKSVRPVYSSEVEDFDPKNSWVEADDGMKNWYDAAADVLECQVPHIRWRSPRQPDKQFRYPTPNGKGGYHRCGRCEKCRKRQRGRCDHRAGSTAMSATYHRRNNGSWGIFLEDPNAASVGTTIRVRKRDGSYRTEKVSSVHLERRNREGRLPFAASSLHGSGDVTAGDAAAPSLRMAIPTAWSATNANDLRYMPVLACGTRGRM